MFYGISILRMWLICCTSTIWLDKLINLFKQNVVGFTKEFSTTNANKAHGQCATHQFVTLFETITLLFIEIRTNCRSRLFNWWTFFRPWLASSGENVSCFDSEFVFSYFIRIVIALIELKHKDIWNWYWLNVSCLRDEIEKHDAQQQQPKSWCRLCWHLS